MIVWGRADDIQREVANVPMNWLYRFAAKRPNDIRKMGEAQGSSLLYRTSAILEAIESGELKRAYNYGKEPDASDIKAGKRKDGQAARAAGKSATAN